MIDPNAAMLFDEALRAAGIPMAGVGILNTDADTAGYPADWHLVVRPDGLVVRVDYLPEATAEQIAQGDDIVTTLDVTKMRPRAMFDIYGDIKALSAQKQAAIAADISANSYEKLKAMHPPQDAPVAVLHWCVTSLAAATQTERYDAYARIEAMYAQQFPDYLVGPAFDTSINIPGDEPVP
jgi:hypothetical protein